MRDARSSLPNSAASMCPRDRTRAGLRCAVEGHTGALPDVLRLHCARLL